MDQRGLRSKYTRNGFRASKSYSTHEQTTKKNSAKASKLELSLIITDLINYVIIHFKNEEEFLQKINYPRLEEHKKIHENLLNQLNIYYTNYLKQENELIDNRFFEFLSLWLSSHIQHFDMDYSYFIQSNSTIPTPQQKV